MSDWTNEATKLTCRSVCSTRKMSGSADVQTVRQTPGGVSAWRWTLRALSCASTAGRWVKDGCSHTMINTLYICQRFDVNNLSFTKYHKRSVSHRVVVSIWPHISASETSWRAIKWARAIQLHHQTLVVNVCSSTDNKRTDHTAVGWNSTGFQCAVLVSLFLLLHSDWLLFVHTPPSLPLLTNPRPLSHALYITAPTGVSLTLLLSWCKVQHLTKQESVA